jgi:hypothetical protein
MKGVGMQWGDQTVRILDLTVETFNGECTIS